MGFVGNYAPWGLSPQTDGMPVIPENRQDMGLPPVFQHFSYLVLHLQIFLLWHRIFPAHPFRYLSSYRAFYSSQQNTEFIYVHNH